MATFLLPLYNGGLSQRDFLEEILKLLVLHATLPYFHVWKVLVVFLITGCLGERCRYGAVTGPVTGTD